MNLLVHLVAVLCLVCKGQSATDGSAAEEICPLVTKWENITRATTMDGLEVEIIQSSFGEQYFFTAKCSPECEGEPCRFIQEGIETRCTTRFNLVPAMTYRRETEEIGWKMIRVPGQCVCLRIS